MWCSCLESGGGLAYGLARKEIAAGAHRLSVLRCGRGAALVLVMCALPRIITVAPFHSQRGRGVGYAVCLLLHRCYCLEYFFSSFIYQPFVIRGGRGVAITQQPTAILSRAHMVR